MEAAVKPQSFYSRKENHVNRITVEFDREGHYNALITEAWCPLSLRLKAAKEPAERKTVVILCETDTEALALAQHHFCLTGTNFVITSKEKNT